MITNLLYNIARAEQARQEADAEYKSLLETIALDIHNEQTKRFAELFDEETQQKIHRIIYECHVKQGQLEGEAAVAHAGRDKELTETIQAYKDEVEPLIIASQQSHKVDGLQAVYTNPRVTWDSKWLDGYASAHPEINAAKKVGKPSVSWRLG